ncbi:MAG: ABC transporter permease [Nocardioidaceae bacterium]
MLAVFFFYPLLAIIWLSLSDPSFGFGNYTDLLTDGVTIKVLVRTIISASIVAIATLAIAYPYAYAMTKVGPGARGILLVIVLTPFWTSLIARTFAWYLLEQQGGLIQRFFALLGFDDVVLRGTVLGVTVAMVQVMLPFMVLPLYSSMASIDPRLLPAAASLGAPKFTAFRTVYFPLSMPGVMSGVTLVFIVSLGFYVTPALLGSPNQALISQVIATRVSDLLDFAGAGAMGAILLLVTLLILWIMNRVGRPGAMLNEVVGSGK